MSKTTRDHPAGFEYSVRSLSRSVHATEKCFEHVCAATRLQGWLATPYSGLQTFSPAALFENEANQTRMSVFQNSGTLRCVHACNNARDVTPVEAVQYMIY